MKILIIRLSSIGDIIQCLPVLYALRKQFPQAHISWAVNEQYAELLKYNPLLNEVIVFPKNKLKQFIKEGDLVALFKELTRFGNELKTRNFDLALDLHGMAKSALVSFLSGAKKKAGIPHMRELSFLVSTPVKSNPEKSNVVNQYLQVAKHLGADITDPQFVLPITEQEKNDTKTIINTKFKNNSVLAGIIPGAGIPQKQWPWQNYVQLIENLTRKGTNVILLGSPEEKNLIDKIVCSLSENQSVLPVVQNNLRQLIAIIDQCNFIVGGDTGPLHIAVALNKNIVALYGLNDPELTGPYSVNAKIVYKELDCSPCGIKPDCTNNRCMQLITVEEVIENCNQFIINM